MINYSTINKLCLIKAKQHLEVIKEPSAIEKIFIERDNPWGKIFKLDREMDILLTEASIQNLEANHDN